MYSITNRWRMAPHEPYVYSYVGKSTDEKPDGESIATGSDFYELDTQQVFMYDAETHEWVQQ